MSYSGYIDFIIAMYKLMVSEKDNQENVLDQWIIQNKEFDVRQWVIQNKETAIPRLGKLSEAELTMCVKLYPDAYEKFVDGNPVMRNEDFFNYALLHFSSGHPMTMNIVRNFTPEMIKLYPELVEFVKQNGTVEEYIRTSDVELDKIPEIIRNSGSGTGNNATLRCIINELPKEHWHVAVNAWLDSGFPICYIQEGWESVESVESLIKAYIREPYCNMYTIERYIKLMTENQLAEMLAAKSDFLCEIDDVETIFKNIYYDKLRFSATAEQFKQIQNGTHTELKDKKLIGALKLNLIKIDDIAEAYEIYKRERIVHEECYD